MSAITYHPDLIQGSDEWLHARLGMLTASEMTLIVTPTLKVASNDKTRAHMYELLAQRISKYVEPRYVSNDMLRGMDDEIEARRLYHISKHKVHDVGFVTNSKWGFTLGYSPDGLVGEDGLIEVKSRRQKFQVQTFIEDCVPEEFMLQLQTGLLVTEREWIDFISYSAGLPMFVMRIEPIASYQDAILAAAEAFENKLVDLMSVYHDTTKGLELTERRVVEEMYI